MWLNWSSKLQENNEKKKMLHKSVHNLCVPLGFRPVVFYYFEGEVLLLAQNYTSEGVVNVSKCSNTINHPVECVQSEMLF